MKSTILSVFVLSSSLAFANEPDLFARSKKNNRQRSFHAPAMMKNYNDQSNIAVKLNLSQLGLKNIVVQGEYGFHNKMSGALSFGRLLPRDFPVFFYEPETGYEENFSMPQLKGWSLTPEFRFYPGGKEEKPAPRGFYIGLYYRYASFSITQNIAYTDMDSPTQPTYEGIADQTYKGYTAGLMIGSQWIIAKHLSLDWWILGGGYGKANYTYKWTAPGANLSPQQQADVKELLDNNFNQFSLFSVDGGVTMTPNSATTPALALPMLSLRGFGLCLGYAF